MTLIAGRIYYAVPQNYLANVAGDVQPVYALICGEDANNRIAVPQNAVATISGDTRPIYGTAGCVDGQAVRRTARRCHSPGLHGQHRRRHPASVCVCVLSAGFVFVIEQQQFEQQQ